MTTAHVCRCEHGTHNRYTHGCRCGPCTDAHRTYTKARRRQALADGRLEHGKRNTYDAGCRCDDCRRARIKAYRTNPGEYQPKTRRVV